MSGLLGFVLNDYSGYCAVSGLEEGETGSGRPTRKHRVLQERERDGLPAKHRDVGDATTWEASFPLEPPELPRRSCVLSADRSHGAH